MDQDLIEEYNMIIEGNNKEIQEKETLLHVVAEILETVNKEKEQKQKQLEKCLQKVYLFIHNQK